MTTKQTTLAVHLEKLKPKEKGIIVWALNATRQVGYEVHQGMLPFINVNDAIIALNLYSNTPARQINNSRILAEVRSKLRQAYGINESVTFTMLLNSKKIAKRFGAHPERGHKIPHVQKKRVTVGVRWSLPKRDHEPDDDVLVAPHVVLKLFNRSGWWEVTCEKQYRNHVTTFLLDYCS